MADPTTQVDLATQIRNEARTASAVAQTAQSDAHNATLAAAKALADAVAAMAALDGTVADIRTQLAAAATRADAEALALQLETATIAWRAEQAAVIEKQAAVAAAKNLEALAAQRATDSQGRLSDAEAALAAATLVAARRAAWATTATTTLAGVPAAAKAARDTAPQNKSYTDAKARIEHDIPADLLARARARRADAAARTDARRKAVADAQDASADALPYALARAETALQQFIGTAAGRLDRAKKQLAGVADPLNSPLTADQKARITDATLTAKGTAAASAEKDRDASQDDLDTAKASLAAAWLKAIHDGVDPNTDAGVVAATADVNTKQGILDTKNNDYTAAMRTDLDTWEAAVPDGTWHLLDDFEDASATLGALVNTDPAQLVADLSTAEDNLVASLLTAYKKDQASRGVEAIVEAREALTPADDAAAAARKFSALRGDS